MEPGRRKEKGRKGKQRKTARRERVTRQHEVEQPAEQAKTRETPADRQQSRPAETDQRPRKHGETAQKKRRQCPITANSRQSEPQSTTPGLQLARNFLYALRALALPKIKSFKLQASSTQKTISQSSCLFAYPKSNLSNSWPYFIAQTPIFGYMFSHTSSHTFPLLYFLSFLGAVLYEPIPV